MVDEKLKLFFWFCNFERAVSDTVPSWTRFWTRFSWQGIYDWLWGMRKTLKFHEDSAKSWVMIIVMLAIFFSCSFDFTDFVNAHFCWSIYIYIIYIYIFIYVYIRLNTRYSTSQSLVHNPNWLNGEDIQSLPRICMILCMMKAIQHLSPEKYDGRWKDSESGKHLPSIRKSSTGVLKRHRPIPNRLYGWKTLVAMDYDPFEVGDFVDLCRYRRRRNRDGLGYQAPGDDWEDQHPVVLISE